MLQRSGWWLVVMVAVAACIGAQRAGRGGATNEAVTQPTAGEVEVASFPAFGQIAWSRRASAYIAPSAGH